MCCVPHVNVFFWHYEIEENNRDVCSVLFLPKLSAHGSFF